jgi:quinol monooxygenase YgiN
MAVDLTATPRTISDPPPYGRSVTLRDVLIVTGSVEARPDTIDRILELGLAHTRRSRQEPGCLVHAVHRDVENELRVVFLEQWEDEAALMAHFHVPASIEFVQEAAALAVGPPEMSIFEVALAPMRNPADELGRT